MISRRLSTASACVLALGFLPSAARAQETASPAPAATAYESAPASGSVSLKHIVSLHLDHVTLQSALATLSHEAGVRIMYSPDEVPLDRIVTLATDRISVRDALTVLLEDTGLEVGTTTSGWITLRPTGGHAAASLKGMQQGTAAISGYVRDSAIGASIPQVIVRVDGTNLVTKSGSDGHYKIVGLAAGEYRITARRVGYLAKTRTITLADGDAKTLNFDLSEPATKLDEVVTTAIGDKRRYEVGTVIGTINVDSIAPTAPITDVTDLMTGRIPGVQIVENSGMVGGGGEAIRVWGVSSLLLQSQPILIVDGIREDNAEGSFGPSPSRINDFDVSQIETLQVLKGPAATTEYGPDAANGVIVITTKRGAAGTTQWNLAATEDANTVPLNFPDLYYNWAHTTEGQATPNATCVLTPTQLFNGNYEGSSNALTTGYCVVDSTTAFTPLDHKATTDLGPGDRQNYTISVGGGSELLRYYLAGALTNAVGGTKVPDVFRSEAIGLGYPESSLSPNSENQRSLRLNTTVQPIRTMSVGISVAYMSTHQVAPNAGIVFGPLPPGEIPYPDSAYDWGYGNYGMAGLGLPFGEAFTGYNPLSFLGKLYGTTDNIWTGGINAHWTPIGWFVGSATLGIENEANGITYATLPQTALGTTPASGYLSDNNENEATYTVNLTGTATASLTSQVRTSTTFGTYITEAKEAGLFASASNLTAADFTLSAGGNYVVQGSATSNASAGVFGEEQVSLHDRLFLIASFGLYSGSNFGGSYTFTGYPKFSVSWLVLTGATTLRLRGAYGPSGQQPPYGANVQSFQYDFQTVSSAAQGGTLVNGIQYQGPGNLNLQPERVTDMEGGFDLGFWRGRVAIEGTIYDKYTQRALQTINLGWDLGQEPYTENIGDVDNRGLEGSITATVIQSRPLVWTTTLLMSTNANKLVREAPGLLFSSVYQAQGFRAGYPLYGVFTYGYQYHDLNHDGIIEPNEMTYDTSLVYAGSTAPRVQGALATTLGVWHNTLLINAKFDYAGDYVVPISFNDFSMYSPMSVLPGASLWLQAMAADVNDNCANDCTDHYVADPGDYVRFSELSATYVLPRAWARAIRVQNLSLTFGVQNVALWTRYAFGDPEVNYASEGFVDNQVSNTGGANADIRLGGSDAVPLMRHWDIRFNLGL